MRKLVHDVSENRFRLTKPWFFAIKKKAVHL
jgi:hypothetical protein